MARGIALVKSIVLISSMHKDYGPVDRTLVTFFALWPDEETRTGLEVLVRTASERSQGRPVARDRLHLTLLYLGQTRADQLTPIETLAAAIREDPFTLEVDRL